MKDFFPQHTKFFLVQCYCFNMGWWIIMICSLFSFYIFRRFDLWITLSHQVNSFLMLLQEQTIALKPLYILADYSKQKNRGEIQETVNYKQANFQQNQNGGHWESHLFLPIFILKIQKKNQIKKIHLTIWWK